MRKLAIGLVGALALLTTAGTASAAYIEGELFLAGQALLDEASPVDASTITFGGLFGASGTDDLSSVSTSNVNFGTPLVFDPITVPHDVWSSTALSGLGFTLTSLSIVQRTASTLVLEGMGFLAATGFDDTLASFSLTFNTTISRLDGFFTTSNAAVPIPAAGWLFGSALVGVVSIARRNRKGRQIAS